MPVQFPDHFVIAGCGVEIGNGRPESHPRAASVHRVELPIDALRIGGEAQVVIPEEVVSAVDETPGTGRRVVPAAGKFTHDAANQRLATTGSKHKAARKTI